MNEEIQEILDEVNGINGVVALTAEKVSNIQDSVNQLQALIESGNPDMSELRSAIATLKSKTDEVAAGLTVVADDAAGTPLPPTGGDGDDGPTETVG